MAETRKVLLALDASPFSEVAFHWYLDYFRLERDFPILATITEQSSKVKYTSSPSVEAVDVEGMKKEENAVSDAAKTCLEKFENEFKAKDVKHYKIVVGSGKPGEEIVKLAKKEEAEVILMGTRGLSTIRRTFMGSVSGYVLDHADLPTIVVPSTES